MAKSTKQRVKGHQWLQAAFQIPQVLLTGTFQWEKKSVFVSKRVWTKLPRRSSENVSMWIFIFTHPGQVTHTPFTHIVRCWVLLNPPSQPHAHVFGRLEETNPNRLGRDRPELGLNQEPCGYEGTLSFKCASLNLIEKDDSLQLDNTIWCHHPHHPHPLKQLFIITNLSL